MMMLLWGVHLGYPMHRLQGIRWTLWGHVVPIYYLIWALLVTGPAAAVLMLKRRWDRWELLWLALPLICLPGILQSSDRLWSGRQWLSWMLRGVIPGGVVFLTASREGSERLLLRWVYPVVIAASLLGLYELYSGKNPLWDGYDPYIPVTAQASNPLYRPAETQSLSRAPRGTQGNRIPYAATVVAFLPFGAWLLKYKKKAFAVNLCAVGVMSSLLLLAQVRSAWVAALAAVLLTHVLGLQRNRRVDMLALAAAAGCLVLFLFWPRTHEMLSRRFDSLHLSEASIRQRLAVLKTAAILKDRGVLGVGFGQYPAACRPYFRGDSKLFWMGTPDNQYLRWAIENGVPSLALLVTFFTGLIRAVWKKTRSMGDRQEADFYRSLLIGWASLAVTFLFFDGFYWGACNMTFWCLLGLIARVASESPGETTEA